MAARLNTSLHNALSLLNPFNSPLSTKPFSCRNSFRFSKKLQSSSGKRALYCTSSLGTQENGVDGSETFVLTTPLYYVNAPPHMGSAYTTIAADSNARFQVINQANKFEKNPSDFSSHFFEDCLLYMSALQCLPTTHQPNCIRDYMGNILQMIDKIIEKDFGYVVDGDVFFSVNKSPNYGKLSGQQLDHTQAAGECLVVDPKKRNPADFALWKATKPGEPNWESPWGPGRPGWHIGCSAISTNYLSPRFDILGGGAYLKFPHHEHVIAQTCAACEDGGVTYWLHNAHVTNNNVEKLENSVTIRDITAKYHPLALRHFLMSAHYRSPLKYSVLQLETSSDALVSVYQTLQDLAEALLPLEVAMSEDGVEYNPDKAAKIKILKLKFHVDKHMSDDLNTVHIYKDAFEDVMRLIRRVVINHKTWQKKRLMPMVVSLIEMEKVVRESLDLLGLLSTQSYAEFLKEMQKMTLARRNLGTQEILENAIDLVQCNGTVKKVLACVWMKLSVELIQIITPAGNIVYYIRKSLASESEARNEFEVMSKLIGAFGVVQCVGSSIHERQSPHSTAFFMEYASGGTLLEEIERHPKGLPLEKVRRYTRMILQGLQSIHEAGFVHGDLHYMNVLLFESEGRLEAKISDFGVSKRIGDSSWWSIQKPNLGCYKIMSPESYSEGTTNEGHDVWAVGHLVKEMISNQKLPNEEATDFVNLCLVTDPERRARVSNLLQHKFLLTN